MRSFALLALCCALALPLAAQPMRPVVSAHLGYFSEVPPSHEPSGAALYPQIEVAFAKPLVDETLFTPFVALTAGVWKAGPHDALVACSRCAIPSQRGINVGARFGVTLERFPLHRFSLPITGFFGLGRYAITTTYAPSEFLRTQPHTLPPDRTLSFFGFEVGARLQARIGEFMRLGVEGLAILSEEAGGPDGELVFEGFGVAVGGSYAFR